MVHGRSMKVCSRSSIDTATLLRKYKHNTTVSHFQPKPSSLSTQQTAATCLAPPFNQEPLH
eukprot:m.116982 g.116982  ORF g.116982 m.116982 type:complete len:61 (-) comp13621_c0_seq2:754-936(-)